MATDPTTTAPTPEEIAAAQAVIAAAGTAAAAAEALRIKPITDLVASAAAQQTLVALEALVQPFVMDQKYWSSINCALMGLRGLGVQAPAAS